MERNVSEATSPTLGEGTPLQEKEIILGKDFPDHTEEFYKFLFISDEELKRGLKQILIIVAGTMGVGKTTLIRNIIKRIEDRYGLDQVNAVSTQVSPSALINTAFKGQEAAGWNARKPVQIIVFDDATSIKLTALDQNEFCKLRHQMMADTGLTSGIIYSILVTHDWYRLDCNFRRQAILTAFLSVLSACNES